MGVVSIDVLRVVISALISGFTTVVISLVLVIAPTAFNMPVGGRAFAGDLSIKTRTTHYRIRARKFSDVSRQMLRRGPTLGRNGRRVWATSRRDYDWRLEYLRQRGKCSVKRAIVRMKITYTLPRLENEKRVSRRFRSKWQRVYKILSSHERAHGRNYRTFATHLANALKKMAPQSSCYELRRAGKRLDKKLHRQSTRRNRRFDNRERGRLTRLQRRIERG